MQTLLDRIEHTTETMYKAHFSDFVRDDKNLRTTVEREELLQSIKSDSGVLVPIIVYPDKNVDGKWVIFEGNCRHWCLERLSTVEDYTGSLDLPFILLNRNVVGNFVKSKLLSLSLGTTNKHLTLREQAKCYQEVHQHLLLEKARAIYPDIDNAPEKTKKKYFRDVNPEVINEICYETGKTITHVRMILRVFEIASKNPFLIEAVEDEVLTVSTLEEITKLGNKYTNIDNILNSILELCKISCKDRKKNKISELDVNIVSEILPIIQKNQDLLPYILKGVLKLNIIEKISTISAKLELDIKALVTEALEYSFDGSITDKQLEIVVKNHNTDISTLLADNDVEVVIKEKKQPIQDTATKIESKPLDTLTNVVQPSTNKTTVEKVEDIQGDNDEIEQPLTVITPSQTTISEHPVQVDRVEMLDSIGSLALRLAATVENFDKLSESQMRRLYQLTLDAILILDEK